MADRKLMSNVNVTDENGVSKWYGPDYPENGDPPEGAVTNDAAYEVEAADLTPRETLEANADPTRAGGELRGVAGADETGDQSRTVSDTPDTSEDRGEDTGEPQPNGGDTTRGRRGGAR